MILNFFMWMLKIVILVASTLVSLLALVLRSVHFGRDCGLSPLGGGCDCEGTGSFSRALA